MRIRVGGQVESAKLISQPKPEYPPVAKTARVQGVVRLDAIIGKDGSIEDLKVISGHPLLIRAALEAVQHWQYQPTFLNGEPVEVATEIDVKLFTRGWRRKHRTGRSRKSSGEQRPRASGWTGDATGPHLQARPSLHGRSPQG